LYAGVNIQRKRISY